MADEILKENGCTSPQPQSAANSMHELLAAQNLRRRGWGLHLSVYNLFEPRNPGHRGEGKAICEQESGVLHRSRGVLVQAS